MSMMPAFSPGPLQHQLAARGQLLQMNARALVGAVLAPHHAEDAELGVAGLAAEQRDDLVVFRPGELVWPRSLVVSFISARRPKPRPWIEKSRGRRSNPSADRRRVPDAASCPSRCASVQNAGDVAQRAVGIFQIAEGDAILGFQFDRACARRRNSSLRRARWERASAGLLQRRR